jgi:DNA repair exonuclease SbcCD ATPase subunit
MSEQPRPPIQPDEVVDSVGQSVRRLDASQLSGQVWVIKRRVLKQVIEQMVDRYADASKPDLVEQRDRRRADLAQASDLNDELQALLAKGQEAIGGLQERMENLRDQITRFKAGEGEQMLEQARERVRSQQQRLNLIQSEAQRTRDVDQEYQERVRALEEEIRQIEERLRSDPILRRVQEAEAERERLRRLAQQLESWLDFHDTEDAWDATRFQQSFDALREGVATAGKKIGDDQVRMFRATQLRDRIVALREDVQEQTDRLESMIASMENGDGTVDQIMAIIEQHRQLAGVHGKLRALAGSLLATVG